MFIKRKIHTLNKKEATLLHSNNLWLLGEGLLGPLYAVFAKEIGGDVLSISWAWATYLIVAGIMTMVVGRLTDSWISKEKTMLLGYLLNALAVFGYLLVSEPIHLLAVQAVFGLALALASPTWYALYAKHENRRRSGATWGIARGQALLATGIALLVGGYIVNEYGFNVLFIMMGTVQLLAFATAMRILNK